VKGKTDFNLTFKVVTRGSHLLDCCCSFCSIGSIAVTGDRMRSQRLKLQEHLTGENNFDLLSVRGRIILKWIGKVKVTL
jgi:hypothetical protein